MFNLIKTNCKAMKTMLKLKALGLMHSLRRSTVEQGRTVSHMVWVAPLAVTGLSNLGKIAIFRFLKFISKNRRRYSSLILKHLTK